MEEEGTIRKERPAGDYILGRKLGSGSFGAVFESRHKTTQLPCAIKRVRLDEADAERFRKEALYPARIAAQSMHVVNVITFFQDPDDDCFYLVTELIPHGDLRDFLDRSPKPLPLQQAVELALGIARGLAAIHEQNITHLDLKPRNILMDRKDETWVPKIADFGLARSAGSRSLNQAGTIGYAAPEQLDWAGKAGPESDMFAFGMILYELLTGRRAAEARDRDEYSAWLRNKRLPEPPARVRPELSQWKELEGLAGRLLERNPAARMASAAEAVRILAGVLQDMKQPQHAPPPPPPVVWRWVAAAVAVFAVAAVAAWALWPEDSLERANALRQEAVGRLIGSIERVDEVRAVELFREASALGDPLAEMWLARGYHRGVMSLPVERERGVEMAGAVMPQVRSAAEARDAEAQFLLASAYRHGLIVTSDMARTVALYDEACSGGFLMACTEIGYLYRDGNGVTKDDRRALGYYTRGCAGGAAGSCANVGYHYRMGLGVTKDDQRAAEYYREGCDRGDSFSCANLGRMHELGEGAPKDVVRAAELYGQGCAGGNAMGCTNLGWMRERGEGVAQDIVQAAELYRQGCDGGSATGCTNLGWLQERGEGVTQDVGRAAELYRRGCDGGSATGCNNLGVLYESGKGVTRDASRAVELYRQGCDGGSALGCSNLGMMYERGDGSPVNIQRAMALYKQACDGSVARACYNLARMYSTHGDFVQQFQVATLYQQACTMGYALACQ